MSLRIGPDFPCFVIAECGINHNGAINLARQLVDAAVEAEVDAVKFQTYRTDEIVAPDNAQYDMLKCCELSKEDFLDLRSYCIQRDIIFLSTPFDVVSADLLEWLQVPAFKIPSGEITNLPLLIHIAAKRKAIFLSTGMATLGEVEEAVQTIERVNYGAQIVLLHCTSVYPADPVETDLRVLDVLKTSFGYPVGLSDHTLGSAVSIAAVAREAAIIEKHLTLSRSMDGPDHAASLEPAEFAQMVQDIRTVESALGDGRKRPTEAERATMAIARRSLVAARDLPAGTVLEADMLVARRPGTGLPLSAGPYLIGRRLAVDVRAGTLLAMEYFA